MIRLTRSDLADLSHYPLSLQQSALALWGNRLADGDDIAGPAAPRPAKTARRDRPSR